MYSKKLQEEWRSTLQNNNSKQSFIFDGIIDSKIWSTNDLKLMFILKEAYTREGNADWDIARLIALNGGRLINKKGQATHNRLAEWAYGIEQSLKGEDTKRFESEKNNWDLGKQSMMKSAYVNVKKNNGKTRSVERQLKKIVNRDKDFIAAQIKLIGPKIILCAGTFDIIRSANLFDGAEKYDKSNICYKWNNKLLIKFCHPARANKESTYKLLTEEIKNIIR